MQCATTATYAAVADAWVDQGSAGSNKGTDSIIKVMSKSGGNLRGLVQFGLPASLPEGCVVRSATLRLYTASPANGRTLQAQRAIGVWSESTVTWSSQPATSGPIVTASSGSGYRQWDVTAQVQAMLTSANHGFVIRDALEGQDAEQQFHAREKGENGPQLVVSYALVTTPTSTLAPPPPPPPPPECAGGPVTYAADADAWVDQGSAGSNKGSDSILKVMSKSGTNLRGMVHFALPATIPVGCVVQAATLRLHAASSSPGRTLHAIPIVGSWSEGSVTWNSQPATGGPAATTPSGSGYRQWDVTLQVQAMLASGVNQGFLIRDAVEGQDAEQQFHAREKGENPPQLVVTFVAAPAPTTTTTTPTTPAPATTVPPMTTTTLPPSTTTIPPTTTTSDSTTTSMPETTTLVPSTTASTTTTTVALTTTAPEQTTTTLAATTTVTPTTTTVPPPATTVASTSSAPS